MQILRPLVCRVLEIPPSSQKQQRQHQQNTLTKRYLLVVGFYRLVNRRASPQDNQRNKNQNLYFLSSVIVVVDIKTTTFVCFKLQCTSELKGVNMFTIPVTVWFFLIVINGTSFMAFPNPPPPEQLHIVSNQKSTKCPFKPKKSE